MSTKQAIQSTPPNYPPNYNNSSILSSLSPSLNPNSSAQKTINYSISNSRMNSDSSPLSNPYHSYNTNPYTNMQSHHTHNSYSSSVYVSSSKVYSKNQTPIKSPSPDQVRTNMITPTKVKYVGVGNEKGEYIESYNTSPFRTNQPRTIKHLQQQIQILTIQNRNLLHKLSQHPQISSSSSSLHSHPHLNSNPPSHSKRPSSQIIQRIKQQYQQKLNTLKLMIQQQIKQAISVIEDMCQLMKNKLIGIENRIENVEMRISEVKIGKIISMEEKWKNGGTGRLYHNGSHVAGVDNSLSDILCVSIPQQSQQQSRQHNNNTQILNTHHHNLQSEIQTLQNLIKDTQQSYNIEREQLNKILMEQRQQIQNLKQDNYKLNAQVQYQRRQKNSFRVKFKDNIRQQLIMLQTNVQQLVIDLQTKQQTVSELVTLIQVKGRQCQNLLNQISNLRLRLTQSNKAKMLIQQKLKYSQQNTKILQNQLSQIKHELQRLQKQKSQLQQTFVQKLSNRLPTSQTQSRIFLLTSRIDKLLLMEEERQRVQGLHQQEEEETRVQGKDDSYANQSQKKVNQFTYKNGNESS